jgi:cytochrome c biogenesis factor
LQRFRFFLLKKIVSLLKKKKKDSMKKLKLAVGNDGFFIEFWLTHIGLFLILLFMSLSSFEFQKLHVRAFRELPENIAISDDNQLFQLPFQITLKNFEAEFYDNYQPKFYNADIILKTDDAEKKHFLQVNHPARFMGYDIYLSSYDQTNSNSPDYVILQAVYDPLVYAKYAGILILLAGLFLYIWKLNFSKNKMTSLFILLSGTGFLFIPFSAYLFGGKNLVPALQSVWFIPHIAVYMFAYASLTVACLLAVYTLFNKRRGTTCCAPTAQKSMDFSLKLGTMLMGIGLLFGMLWGKKAWGNFWNWDLKETWALIAWAAYLGVLHFNYFFRTLSGVDGHVRTKARTLSILIIIAFILLQICWFGINYFPESWKSLHRY